MLFTFQSGDIQIYQSIQVMKPSISIYIPIWWYSNYYRVYLYLQSEDNLHSNLVIFKSDDSEYHTFNLARFTFQSGDIQISKSYRTINARATFTFQSGDIQMRNFEELKKLIEQIYIPIWWYSNFAKKDAEVTADFIYIPIWWYSNSTVENKDCSNKKIYIPIWWYSNKRYK